MNIFELEDYREIIRTRVRVLSATRKHYSLKMLAAKIPIQYTYFSKALNDPKTHLNEDHLFTVSRLLEFLPEEADYLFLLRSLATSQDPLRQKHLRAKIDRIQKAKKLSADVQTFQSSRLNLEMAYLFDPFCPIVHASLHITEFRDHPRRLCAILGITPARLKEILRKLSDLAFIELAEDRERVNQVLMGQIHYSADHPLMRANQTILRQLSAARVHMAPDEEKHSFMVTFSADSATFAGIKARYQDFIKDVEKLAGNASNHHTYQLNFDLFKWL
ncbi:MAG TPA: hypothetical protein DCS07_18195 [Bdellovibrionales bacterium]|nr:MAG: hypothetical protein A2Z97_01890 [Bdellovibrionales bacterium GWB1_52_6]OFZ04904.1 MAG: hypothetical protein A2X97_16185 [Bdellovibrionales bacterium GWA1_52_35]OFZ40433.1 MAG: hypothetical protein A2070_02205 [Bdellovibrionales bacterium GWC1_52_8]HAR44534.1 hypothetical protein [Bdellovibrionales bacterium]HCM38836.1 hypothetical protein [Bdellovibrionales bacterium]